MLLQDCRYLLTQDADRTIREHVDVRIDDGRIRAIGTDLAADGPTIDCADMVVLPGLINCHTHAAMNVLRGISDDRPLQRWLEEAIFPAEDRMDDTAVRAGTRHACMEMLLSGTTACNDMYWADRMPEIVAGTGMRAVLGLGVTDQDGATDKALARSAAFIERCRDQDRITPAVAPHAIYTCSDALLDGCRDQADAHDVPYHIHLAETAQEVADCRDAHGTTPTQHCADLGLLDGDTVAAHGTHLTAEDIATLADAGAGVAHNPCANLKLAAGIAPVPQLQEAGVRVGLGTDGVASNNSLDMLEELKFGALLQKRDDPRHVPAQRALDMATRDAAALLGLEDCGRAVAGARADLIGLALDDPALQPVTTPEDVISHLAFAATGPVDLTVVGGDVLVRDGQPVTMDPGQVRAELQDAAQQVRGPEAS